MKRWPLVASFVLFIALCATLAYWAMQFFKPPVRPVAAPPPSVQAPPNIDAAASLFGGKGSTAVASNFQLKGVIMAGTPADSVAIIAADGKSAEAVRVDREIAPGVKVKEVNRGYVVLLDNGVEKRVELPEEAGLAGGMGSARAAPVASAPMPPRTAPAMRTTVVNKNSAGTASPDASTDTSERPAANPAPDGEPASAQQSDADGPNAESSPASVAQQSARPAAAPAPSAVAPSPAPAPAPPGAGMGSPPITNQGSLAGSANRPAAAAPVAPGMPVTPQPPPR